MQGDVTNLFEIPSVAQVTTISYDDLLLACQNIDSTSSFRFDKSINTDELIEKAFGSSSLDSLGIIAITDIPSLSTLRLNLLPLARKLAIMPAEQLEAITNSKSCYQVGWSHGKEKLEGDKLDFGKGSFYANPLTDDLAETVWDRRKYLQYKDRINSEMDELLKWDESIGFIRTEEELKKFAESNPAIFAPNVWPSNSLPELEALFKEVGILVHKVGVMIAKCCDAYVALRCPSYERHKLEKILQHSKCCKGRLLHYFAKDGGSCSNSHQSRISFSDWCGWHNDHGTLTGLLSALYLDSDGKIIESPDPLSGLYIRSRTGKLVHVVLPDNAVAFQVGETMQVHTGGFLQATPHAVRGCSEGNVTRETFAVFMEPEYHTSMDLPDGRTIDDTQSTASENSLPSTVRTLRSRWKPGMNFGEFSNATFAAFH